MGFEMGSLGNLWTIPIKTHFLAHVVPNKNLKDGARIGFCVLCPLDTHFVPTFSQYKTYIDL